jgi:hypothetical protein
MPNVGVSVAPPAETGWVAVADIGVGLIVPTVAVTGVVVRLGAGDEEGVSVTTKVGEAATTTVGVSVWIGGTTVGEGRAAMVCAWAV